MLVSAWLILRTYAGVFGGGSVIANISNVEAPAGFARMKVTRRVVMIREGECQAGNEPRRATMSVCAEARCGLLVR